MNNKLAARQILQNDFAIVTVLALFKLIFHLATSSGYGYFRDELYYIAASKHLAWGYVDFPPFVAFITAITRRLFGESLFALHLFPALAGALIVLLAGLMARELGGGKFAQGLAALAVLVAPQFLGTDSLLSMDAFDQLWWVLAAYVVILIFKRDDPRLWLAFGIVAGIGFLTKVTMAYFGAALVVGLLLTSHRKYLTSKWLWLGGVIALVIFSPYIVWQIANGFPTLDFWKMYASGKTYPVTPIEFIAQQILIMQPFALPLWLAGLAHFLFARDGKNYRPLGISYVVLFVVFMLQQAKSYFFAPAYPMLFAAGALALERFIARRAWNWLKPTYATLLIVSGALMAPMAMPLLPVEMFISYASPLGSDATIKQERLQTAELPQHFADRFGWEEMTATVARVYRGLSPQEQAQACIFTGNYGEAGAIDFFGKKYGLPNAISGHNSYWLWGPADCTGEIVIGVGIQRQDWEGGFARVEQADVVHCQYCMPYENNRPVYLGRDLQIPLKANWIRVRHYD